MNCIIIGGVTSTKITLEKLIEHNLQPVAVFGYEPVDNSTVSGHVLMSGIANSHDIPYFPFKKINDHIANVRKFKPDIIFVVGLSQLVSQKILGTASLGCIGYHPTLLPEGRGRAPMAWLALKQKNGASNLFLMTEGVDDGPIFIQKKFSVEKNDDAKSIEDKVLVSLNEALDEWLPQLRKGIWNPIPQNEYFASWYGVRKPDDGLINWNESANSIDRLIKASTRPHPGAFSFIDGQKIIIWKSRPEVHFKIEGVVSRILIINSNNELLVQTANGLLWLLEYTIEESGKPIVGKKLGYYPDIEINQLKKQIFRINEILDL